MLLYVYTYCYTFYNYLIVICSSMIVRIFVIIKPGDSLAGRAMSSLLVSGDLWSLVMVMHPFLFMDVVKSALKYAFTALGS